MRAGIALGSNIGDRLANLRAARARVLELPGAGGPVKSSRVFETEPVGCEPGAEAFLNAVVEIEWEDSGAPESLLAALRGIENAMGRPARHPRNEPRVIDLDLLFLGDIILKSDALTLPHPRLSGRRFVLAPLADIRPELVLPGETRTIAELLARLPEEPRVVPCEISF